MPSQRKPQSPPNLPLNGDEIKAAMLLMAQVANDEALDILNSDIEDPKSINKAKKVRNADEDAGSPEAQRKLNHKRSRLGDVRPIRRTPSPSPSRRRTHSPGPSRRRRSPSLGPSVNRPRTPSPGLSRKRSPTRGSSFTAGRGRVVAPIVIEISDSDGEGDEEPGVAAKVKERRQRTVSKIGRRIGKLALGSEESDEPRDPDSDDEGNDADEQAGKKARMWHITDMEKDCFLTAEPASKEFHEWEQDHIDDLIYIDESGSPHWRGFLTDLKAAINVPSQTWIAPTAIKAEIVEKAKMERANEQGKIQNPIPRYQILSNKLVKIYARFASRKGSRMELESQWAVSAKRWTALEQFVWANSAIVLLRDHRCSNCFNKGSEFDCLKDRFRWRFPCHIDPLTNKGCAYCIAEGLACDAGLPKFSKY